MTSIYRPSLEFRIPISPNEKYMRMLHFFVESLQLFGGEIARNAHCVVLVGEDVEPFDLSKQYGWILDYSLEFIWVDRALFCKDSFDATGYQRFWIHSDADIIAMVDVDLLFTGDFDDIIIESFEKQCLSGFIAHVSPFYTPEFHGISGKEMWNKLFNAAGLKEPEFEFEYTGWGLMSHDPEHRFCPAYFNYGIIIAPRNVVEQMGKNFTDDLKIVDSVIDVWFRSQIANTLNIYRNNIPYNALSINYNFPLHVPDTKIRELNLKEDEKNSVEDIKIFHYLGDGIFNKEDFASQPRLNSALSRTNLDESARYFQKKLNVIHEKIKAN
jgi:hypothetical protein